MTSVDLAALRKRARLAGIEVGALARTDHAKRLAFEAAEAKRAANRQGGEDYRPSRSQRFGWLLPRRESSSTPQRIDETGARWVVAMCKPGNAIGVADDLRALGFRCLCPIGREVIYRARGKNGKRERRVREYAVFGSYLFVGEVSEPLASSVHDRIEFVISDSGGPLSVRPQVIRVLNDLELRGKWNQVKAPAAGFQIGQEVRVTDGPFAYFLGMIEELRGNGAIKVGMDIFGQKTPVEIEACQLEKVGV
jgi:transcription antitermination factor NusG